MDGTRAFVVALLLCVTPIGGVVVADTAGDAGEPQQTTEDSEQLMSVYTAENTSEYLAPSPDRIDRADGATVGLDVTAAVGADAGAVESAYLARTLERRYANAETDAERRTVVENGTERLTAHVDALVARERNAVRRYNDGAIGERELLRALAVAGREAEVTAGTLEWLELAADGLDMDAEAERAASGQVRLVPMRGPVRTGLVDAAAGERPLDVYVETADDGIVLAAIDRTDGTYLREAHDPTVKTDATGDQYEGNPSPALDRFSELYPWVINSFDGIDAIGPERVRLYRFSATHPHGELETYLDSGSTEILYEQQRIRAESAPKTTLERTDGDLTVRLNTTRAAGPLEITVLDATSETPVDAEVELNGDPIGSTGADRLWTIAPRGSTVINATHASETASIETTFD
ncbi:hypothetical protein [Natronomonas sp.]|uniref:DUF7096 domain-containing protein n=1 Tax=Natronomonas sp. TaxID=2184060 RepID=UPI003974F61E